MEARAQQSIGAKPLDTGQLYCRFPLLGFENRFVSFKLYNLLAGMGMANVSTLPPQSYPPGPQQPFYPTQQGIFVICINVTVSPSWVYNFWRLFLLFYNIAGWNMGGVPITAAPALSAGPVPYPVMLGSDPGVDLILTFSYEIDLKI